VRDLVQLPDDAALARGDPVRLGGARGLPVRRVVEDVEQVEGRGRRGLEGEGLELADDVGLARVADGELVLERVGVIRRKELLLNDQRK